MCTRQSIGSITLRKNCFNKISSVLSYVPWFGSVSARYPFSICICALYILCLRFRREVVYGHWRFFLKVLLPILHLEKRLLYELFIYQYIRVLQFLGASVFRMFPADVTIKSISKLYSQSCDLLFPNSALCLFATFYLSCFLVWAYGKIVNPQEETTKAATACCW